MKMKKIALIATVIITFAGCYNDKYDKLYPQSAVTTCDTNKTISYATDIQPIIADYCYSPGNGCHDAVGASNSGYDFTTYNGLAPVATQAILVNDLNWTPTAHNNDMPKNGTQLPACDIDKITRWVNEGAPNN